MIDVLIMQNGLRNVQLLKLYVHASSQVIMNNPAAFTAGCHSLALLRFYSRFISRVTCISGWNKFREVYAIVHAARYTQAHPVMSAHLPNHEQSKQWD